MEKLIANAELINEQLARYGVKFGIYKNGNKRSLKVPFL